MSMRGVRAPGSRVVTSAVRGIFRSNAATRAEVLALIEAPAPRRVGNKSLGRGAHDSRRGPSSGTDTSRLARRGGALNGRAGLVRRARHLATRALFRVVRVRGLDLGRANILKQEMLARGGEVAISEGLYEWTREEGDCVLMGTLAQFERRYARG